jgi:hypothetical protein
MRKQNDEKMSTLTQQEVTCSRKHVLPPGACLSKTESAAEEIVRVGGGGGDKGWRPTHFRWRTVHTVRILSAETVRLIFICLFYGFQACWEMILHFSVLLERKFVDTKKMESWQMEEHYRHTDVTRKYITGISNDHFRGETLIHRPKDFTLLSFTSDLGSHTLCTSRCVPIKT